MEPDALGRAIRFAGSAHAAHHRGRASWRPDVESPEYDTIDLPANTTIVMTQPLEITHSVQIVGNNATLLFQQGDTAPWPASASGAIYVDPAVYPNIQLNMSNFTIKFDMSSPIRWSNPAGTVPALFRPREQSLWHPARGHRDGWHKQQCEHHDSHAKRHVGLRSAGVRRLVVTSLQSLLVQQGDTADQYVGEQAIDLVSSNFADSGTISNSTFQGGPIEVFGGPWTITDNAVLGSMADTYSWGAFGVHSAHDVVVEGNYVSQSNPAGREFRLIVLANSGFDNTVRDNSVGGGVGQLGNEMDYAANHGAIRGHQFS